jgi:hypothetical protein
MVVPIAWKTGSGPAQTAVTSPPTIMLTGPACRASSDPPLTRRIEHMNVTFCQVRRDPLCRPRG